MAVKVVLIRHGLTILGEEKRYQGALDTPLSSAGRDALQAADFAPVRVFVSPMLRARETAALLFPQAEIVPVPGLQEMNFGVFEGRGWWEMEEDTDYRAWVDGYCRGRCPGGEDHGEFSARVCAAFDALAREAMAAGEEELVIVAHGGTQMAVMERWGEPAREYYRWQTACGHGLLLEAEAWPGKLTYRQEVSFNR